MAPLFDDTRDTWGALSPKHPLDAVSPALRTEFFVHYVGGDPLQVPDHRGCLSAVRAFQAYHQNRNGWADIGYNGLVCQHGRAIEGRGVLWVGAHCPNHNTTGYGFQFMVGGQQVPSDAAKARMRQLYDECSRYSGRALLKKGHRDGYATECPGDAIHAWVRSGMPAPRTVPPIPAPSTTANQEAGLSAQDAQQVNNYTRALLLDGYTTGGQEMPSIRDILVENQRRITALAKAVQPAAVAAAVRAALPADAGTVNVDALAKAIVLELGKDG